MIKTVGEYERGCGFRKGGGLYLTAPKTGRPCGKLPIVLGEICRQTIIDILTEHHISVGSHVTTKQLEAEVGCGQLIWNKYVDGDVIKQSRSYRKIENPAPLFAEPCKYKEGEVGEKFMQQIGYSVRRLKCKGCPLDRETVEGPMMLDWIGKRHYPTAVHFEMEAVAMGVSRRIRHVPDWFDVGNTWVALAHRNAIKLEEEEQSDHVKFLPAIIKMYRPTEIQYVVTGYETADELREMIRKGITPVRIENKGTFDPDEAEDFDREKYDALKKLLPENLKETS